MTFEATFNLEIIEVMEDFIDRNRPPENIRKKLDLGYRIDKQNIFLFEIRPDWMNPQIIRHYDFAKTTYNKRRGI